MGEKSVQSEILLKFGARPDMRIWRVNTGKAYGYSVVASALARAGMGEILSTMPLIKYGTPGAPDIQGILRGGRFFSIEVKRPGKKIEEDSEQDRWRRMFEAYGGLFIEAHSVEEVRDGLLKAGIG